MCLHYRLHMVFPSLSVEKLISEWSEDFSRKDGLGCSVGCYTRRASQGEPGGWYWCYCSRVGLPSNTHMHKISNVRSPQLWAGQTVAQLGMSFSGAVVQLRMSL